MDTGILKEQADFLITYLEKELRGANPPTRRCGGFEESWARLRALMNVRPPKPLDPQVAIIQDSLLTSLIEARGIMRASSLPAQEGISLWRGDITTLDADAIVNAANSQMLGCFVPGHHCIDNAIHTFAGMQLRWECAQIMARQEHPEPIGKAKVTHGYNLPARQVIHTVGPTANGNPSKQDERDLASCYASCLDAAVSSDCASIAFCCISTGVFGFPCEPAAAIAVSAVRTWLEEHPDARLHIVFDVFTDEDERIYHDLLDR